MKLMKMSSKKNSFVARIITLNFISKNQTRYLPGIKLPENIVAVPDLLEACKDATLLIFVVPHQVKFIFYYI